MPDFTITLTNSQAQRVASAFSFLNDGDDATAAQVKDWIKEKVKEEVRRRQVGAAQNIAAINVDADLDSEGW